MSSTHRLEEVASFLERLSDDSPVRTVIDESWGRCRSAPLDPRQTPLHRISDIELASRLEDSADLIAAARQQLEWISALLLRTPHVVYVCDADGIVLASTGTDPVIMREAGLEPGYDWSERRMGTNGAGTALVTGRPEAVIGAEHYAEAFRSCTCTAAPVVDADGHRVGAIDITTMEADGVAERLMLATHAALVIGRDLAAIRTARQSELLKRVTVELLSSTGDPAEAVMRLPRLLVGPLGDWAVLYVREPTDNLHTVVAHSDEMRERVLRELWSGERTPADEPGHPAGEALRTGSPVVWPQVSAGDLRELTASADQLRMFRLLGPTSYLCVPLRIQNSVAGVLLLGSSRRYHVYGGQDMALAEDLMNLAGLAAANARMHAEAERRAVEAEHAQHLLSALLEHVPEGITIATAPDVRIRAVSQYGTFMAGRDRAELEIPVGDPGHATSWGILHPDGTPASDDELPLTRAVRAGEVSTGEEWLLQRPDGTRLTILTNAGPIRDSDGTVTGGVIAWRDISELKRVERHLRENEDRMRELYQAAEAAVRTREEVLGVVSHDLRNPLNTILMGASLLHEADLPEEKKAVQLTVIKRAVHHMIRLIDDLLDATRMQTGGLRVVRRPLEPSVLVLDAVTQIQPLLHESGVTPAIEVPDGLPPVLADRQRIAQVFDNLLSNALRYAPAGSAVRLTAHLDGDGVCFGVSDEGPGVPEEERAHLFEQFWQGKRGGNGRAGLGLSICHGIVTAHDGRIWLDESAGAGTTIRFTIPVADGAGSD